MGERPALDLIRQHVTVATLAPDALTNAWAIICESDEVSQHFYDAYSELFSDFLQENVDSEQHVATEIINVFTRKMFHAYSSVVVKTFRSKCTLDVSPTNNSRLHCD